MRIKKIRYNRATGKVAIGYEALNASSRTYDSHNHSSKEEPAQSFINALDALAPFVAEIREEPKKFADSITVTGLTVSYGQDDHSKCVITAHRELENGGPAQCHTPLTPITAEEDEAHTVSLKCAQAIEEMTLEAQKYLKGHRRQMQIGEGESEEEGGEDQSDIFDGGEEKAS